MKTNLTLITLLTFTLVVIAVPAFAQHGGLGAGVGLGGGARVGAGGGAQVGGTTVGARTDTDVHAKASTHSEDADRKRDNAQEKSEAHSGAAIVTRIDSHPEMASRVQ